MRSAPVADAGMCRSHDAAAFEALAAQSVAQIDGVTVCAAVPEFITSEQPGCANQRPEQSMNGPPLTHGVSPRRIWTAAAIICLITNLANTMGRRLFRWRVCWDCHLYRQSNRLTY